MNEVNIPFRPIRDAIYTSEEMSESFDPEDADSLVRTSDFRTYEYFVENGRAAPIHPYAGMMQALHDHSILRGMFKYLQGRQRIAAIMGGHREPRGSDLYRGVAAISKRLSEAGFLMASGGGPGAMEATHLGALMSGYDDDDLSRVLADISSTPALPTNASQVIAADGTVDPAVARLLHAWAVPAYEIMKSLPTRGESLAVPTWHYGHEPVTPVASHIAKFFQNSIREDVLLLLASQGIVFAEGRGGTVQEVFQDAAQNYYPGEGAKFAPMVFYDHDAFWSQKLPVATVLEKLFDLGGLGDVYRDNVLVTDDVEEIVAFLIARSADTSVEERAAELGMAALMDESTRRVQ